MSETPIRISAMVNATTNTPAANCQIALEFTPNGESDAMVNICGQHSKLWIEPT